MALNLTKELPSGASATYHRVLAFSVQVDTARFNPGTTGPLVTVEVGEYLTKEARDAGKSPLRTEVRSFVIDAAFKVALTPIYEALARGLPENPEVLLGYEGATPI